MASFAVILPAAGRSVRFGGGRDKLLEPLAGRAVIARAVDAFLRRSDVGLVVIATNQRERIEPALRSESNAIAPRITFCEGGASRAESVLAGVRHVPDSFEWIAVHDAARPLTSDAVITRAFAGAREHGAAVPAMPVTLTVKQADGPLPARVQRTIPRQTLWAMQTPQAMRRADLLAAYERCPLPLGEVTDDVQLIELAGKDVWLVEGEERNLKVTTAADLKLAEMWLAER